MEFDGFVYVLNFCDTGTLRRADNDHIAMITTAKSRTRLRMG